MCGIPCFLVNILVLPGRPEKLEVTQGMQLEQVKRKIPSVLFSWDTYSASREGQPATAVEAAPPENAAFRLICIPTWLCSAAVMKCGMSCSLFEVVDGKGKATSGSLAALLNRLERDRMVRYHGAGFAFRCQLQTNGTPKL